MATVAWSALWAWFDLMVVRWAFPLPLSPSSNIQLYWYATWGFVFPLASMFAFREHVWFPIAAVLAGAWEDLLFYWLVGIVVIGGPGWTFYVRGAVFLPLAILGDLASHRFSRRRSLVAAGVILLILAVVVNPIEGALLAAAVVVYLVYRELAELLQAYGRTRAHRP